MLNIASVLNGQDLGFLKIVANGWGIELKAPDAYTARTYLTLEMNNPEIIREIYDTLPETVRTAFDAILENHGRIPWAKFVRDYGDIQVMGAAKRDRERPDLHPSTPTENLWYRAFIGRAFLSIDAEPQEYVYIPEEIFAQLEPVHHQKKQIPGRPASVKETQTIKLSSDLILDDSTTLLAAIRNGFSPETYSDYFEFSTNFQRKVLTEMGILLSNGDVNSEKTRLFLEAPREIALSQMIKAWMESEQINEIEFVPGLSVDGILDRNHKKARQFVLEQLSLIPIQQWWNIESFIEYIFQTNPDFQRPVGNYDTWYIKKAGTEDYLRGFAHWDAVDGALLRFLITGPLYWLGLIDLALSEGQDQPASFRCSGVFNDLITFHAPEAAKPEEGRVTIDSYGKITFSTRYARAIRYQLSRFCEWVGKSREGFIYTITTNSLTRASEQGLKVNHLIKIIQPVLNHPFPPKLIKSLENWEKLGTQAFIHTTIILQISDPEVVKALLSSSVKKFILAVFNPNTVSVSPGGIEQVRKTLLELGYFSDFNLSDQK